jgi:LmbE family N-acetylglucosaminyl deacetylase
VEEKFMKRKLLLVIAVLLLIFATSTYAYTNNNDNKYSHGINISSTDRVLIVAPHPDDETIGGSGVIRYCLENNIPIYVVVVTNGGDGSIGNIRYHESLNATSILGLPSSNITFFEYTQGVDSLFNENWDKAININGNHTPKFAFQNNAPYNGVSLEHNFETVISNFKPTIIIYPNPEDSNPDHWGTSSFVEYVTNKLNYNGRMYTYLVHVSSVWPFPRGYFPQTYMLPPYFMTNTNKWFVFPINASDEQLEYQAIKSYHSQLNNDPTYLLTFVRKNDLFAANKQITIVKNNYSINLIKKGSRFPTTIFKDPKGDALIKPPLEVYYTLFSNLNLFDITDVGFEIDNTTTWMSLKTVGGISKTGVYDFHIRSFGNNEVNRVDIKVQHGHASYLNMASNSVYPKYPIKAKIEGSGIIIAIPSNLLNGTKYMVSVDSKRNNQYVDRAGWYTVNVIDS